MRGPLLVVTLVRAHLVLCRRSLARRHAPSGLQPGDVSLTRIRVGRGGGVPILVIDPGACWLLHSCRLVATRRSGRPRLVFRVMPDHDLSPFRQHPQ